MSKTKNIVLLMTDQHRPDYLGCVPDGRLALPNIDRLAEGTAFTNCVSVDPVCTPARTALLTGKYPHQIGTLSMAGDLSPQHPTYARALQKAGYWTAGIGKFHWLQGWIWGTPRGGGHDLVALREKMQEYGFDYVWETAGKQLALANYCEHCKHLDEKGLLEAYRDHVGSRGPNVTRADQQKFTGEPWPFDEADYVDVLAGDRMVEAIRSRPKDRPMFLFGSFCSPHPPYDPPASYLERVPEDETDDFLVVDEQLPEETKRALYKVRRAYKAMLLLVDEQVGRVMQALEDEDILGDTVVLFTADHGEMLGDRGQVQKSAPWHSSAVVPCLVRHPDYLSATRNASPVELTDLTATLLDVAGLDPQSALALRWPAFHDRVPSRSLMPIVSGQADRVRDFAFSECDGRWQMIQTDRWKYIRYLESPAPDQLREELYDLNSDPHEIIDRSQDLACAETLAWCRRRRDWVLDRTPPAQTRWAPIGIEQDHSLI